MKQAENSGRGVMINMNNKRRLCGEGVGASMVDDTRLEPTVEVEQSLGVMETLWVLIKLCATSHQWEIFRCIALVLLVGKIVTLMAKQPKQSRHVTNS